MKNHVIEPFRVAVRQRVILAVCLILCAVVAARSQDNHLHKYKIITFQAPGAGTGQYEGTLGYGINAQGEINGYYTDPNLVIHGFLRNPEGGFTKVDGPGASAYTVAIGLNQQGATVGTVANAKNVQHGFLRRPDGSFESFTAPHACTTTILKNCYATTLVAINDFGTMAGNYADPNLIEHGLIISPDGTYTEFSAPGAGNVKGSYQGTYTSTFSGLNQFGEITGGYIDSENADHGYVRYPDGTIIAFDVSGAGTGSGQGTYAASLTDFGIVTGAYVDSGNVYHGFLRYPDGNIITFDVPGAGTSSGQGTAPSNINDTGEITGSYIDSSNVAHGFLTTPYGTVVKFDAPGAGTKAGQGTYPYSNNFEGAITGYYLDGKNLFHAFLLVPCGRDWDGEGCQDFEESTLIAPAVSSSATLQTPTTTNRLIPLPRVLNHKLSKGLVAYR
jgi:hypothetical protein